MLFEKVVFFEFGLFELRRGVRVPPLREAGVGVGVVEKIFRLVLMLLRNLELWGVRGLGVKGEKEAGVTGVCFCCWLLLLLLLVSWENWSSNWESKLMGLMLLISIASVLCVL